MLQERKQEALSRIDAGSMPTGSRALGHLGTWALGQQSNGATCHLYLSMCVMYARANVGLHSSQNRVLSLTTRGIFFLIWRANRDDKYILAHPHIMRREPTNIQAPREGERVSRPKGANVQFVRVAHTHTLLQQN